MSQQPTPPTLPPPPPPPPGYLPPRTSITEDPTLRRILPVGCSAMSIISGYLGLLSVLLWPLGPFAVGLGIWGLLDIRKHPNKCGGGRCITGIITGGIGTVMAVVMLVGLALR